MSIRSISNSATQYFVIDKSTRTITAPAGFKTFGVESDENSNRVYFQCPRYVGDNLDLATLNIRVNFQNANKEKDQYIVTDVAIDGENIRFSWVLSRKATAYKGSISFIICAVKTNAQGVITNEWNTTLATGAVLSGLEVEAPEIPEEVTDVVNQLLDIVDTAKSDMEAATAEGMANIKTAENQAIEAVLNTPNSLMANAIKGSASGEIIAVHDVSPLEHTVNVKVQSKNLLPYPFPETNITKNGGSFIAQPDGGVVLQGTPTALSSILLYQSNPLATEGLVTVSLTGDFKNAMFYFEIKDIDGNTLFTTQEYEAVTVDLGTVLNASQWWIEIKRRQDNVEMSGTAYLQVEKGSVTTEYTPYVSPESVILTRCEKISEDSEPYNGTEYTPSADGIVNVTSLAPNMTLFTDTNGVNIECEYNKDSNVVIQELIERIATLENQGS